MHVELIAVIGNLFWCLNATVMVYCKILSISDCS